MIRTHTKAFLATAAAVLFAAGISHAATIYDNTGSPRQINPSDQGPGYVNDNDFGSSIILWDEVPVAVGANVNPAAVVTQVSLDISRLANAQGMSYSIYWTDMIPDNGANRGSYPVPTSTFDSPIDDPGTAHLIGTGTLGANGNAYGRTTITVGDGVNPLFTTGTLDTTTPDYSYANDDYETGLHPGFGYFFIGLTLTPNSASVNPQTGQEDNGWTLASSPNDLFLATDDYQDGNPSNLFEYYDGLDSSNNPVEGTQMMKVLGNVVPEPTSLSLLGLVGVGAIARRRRA